MSGYLKIYNSTKELWPILKESNVFIRTSITDGDANSLREANYFDNVVIASDCVRRPDFCILYRTNDVNDLLSDDKKSNFYKNSLMFFSSLFLAHSEEYTSLKELHEARGALNRFIAENPSERDSKDLAFLSGEIFRREKRYKEAISEYKRSMGSQYDEDAMFYYAWAMLQLDPNSEDAFRKLAKYRTQFPKGRHGKAVNAALNGRFTGDR